MFRTEETRVAWISKVYKLLYPTIILIEVQLDFDIWNLRYRDLLLFLDIPWFAQILQLGNLLFG